MTKHLVEQFLTSPLQSLPKNLDQFCNPELKFSSPLAKTQGLIEFAMFLLDIRWKFTELQLKKIFVDGDDVCAVYTKTSMNPDVGELLFTDLFKIQNGKILSIESIFNAKPLLDSSAEI